MQISKQRVGGGGGQAGQRVAYGLWILAGENAAGVNIVLLQLPPAGCSRPSLGSESAGMMRHSSSSIVDLPT